MIVVDLLEKKLGAGEIKNHLAVITSPRTAGAPKSLLHPVADKYGLRSLDIPLNVGGRFSVFTPVGLFPVAMLGMDIDALMEGCAAMDVRCSQPGLTDNPAYLRAAIQYLMDTEKGKNVSVMMPYADALRDVAAWYSQLWAESLGKRLSLDGEEVFAGQTPVGALGATDQHSQVQLFREGPNDKIFNVIEVANFGGTLKIPKDAHRDSRARILARQDDEQAHGGRTTRYPRCLEGKSAPRDSAGAAPRQRTHRRPIALSA